MTTHSYPNHVLVHPFLSLPASIHSHWLGRHALHGGAFRYGDRTWALLADKEGGKSSTLAALLGRGCPVVSDDVLVLAGTTLFAGPRCVDLREETAAVLGGENLGVVGSRGRWRLPAGDVPAAMRLDGVIQLAWGDAMRAEELDPGARLAALIAQCVVRPDETDALALLELAALPALRFVRPRDITLLDESIDALLSSLPGAGAGSS